MIHFQRPNNCEGYIEAVRKFLPYSFSFNRHNYASTTSASSHPSAQISLKEEGFTVSLTGKPHSKIPMDEVIEVTKKPVV